MRTRHVIIVCIAALIFAWFIWPTPYRYDKVTIGDTSILVRTNRFTGKRGGGREPKTSPVKTDLVLPDSESVKITGRAGIKYGSVFGGDIYNGTDWIITKIMFQISLKDRKGAVLWDRKFGHQFGGYGSSYVRPFSSSSFSFSVGDVEGMDSIEWTIFEAYGYKNE